MTRIVTCYRPATDLQSSQVPKTVQAKSMHLSSQHLCASISNNTTSHSSSKTLKEDLFCHQSFLLTHTKTGPQALQTK